MGEEKREGEGNGSGEGKKQEKEEKGEDEKIVLKVDMHCEACAKKLLKAIRGFEGVEEAGVDRMANIAVVKGKSIDPTKLCHTILKKTARFPQILSAPLPKDSPPVIHDKTKEDQPPPPQLHKDQPPPITTVVLRVQMHCEACAQLLRKRLRKIKGVESVETDVGNDKITVKGVIADPGDLVKYVYKRTRKQASIVKEEDKKQDDQQKKEDEKQTKEEKQRDNTSTSEEEEKVMMNLGEVMNRYDYYWPTRYGYTTEYSYNYNHHPQFFSDENPNACSIM